LQVDPLPILFVLEKKSSRYLGTTVVEKPA